MVNNLNINGTIYQNVAKLKVKRDGANTYADMVDTSDATALAGDIKSGKNAYVNGVKVIGTYEPPVAVSPNATGNIIVSDTNQQTLANVITFYDEYGEILYTIDTTDNTQFPLNALPTLPTAISGYTFTWNKTLTEVNNMTTGGSVLTRVVADSLTPTILYPQELGFIGSITLYMGYLTSSLIATIDWGDGSSQQSVSITTKSATVSHTFSTYSHNPITITPSSSNGVILGGTPNTSRPYTAYSFVAFTGQPTYFYQFSSKCAYLIKEIRLGNNFHFGNNALVGACGLERIIIPEGSTVGQCAFSSCQALRAVSLPSNIISLPPELFSSQSVYSTTTTPAYQTLSGSAFCRSLRNIVWLGNVTYISIGAFRGCEKLTNIDISNVSTLEASVFSACYNLKSIKLNNSLTTIDESTFSNCYMLNNINLENITNIGVNAFTSCRSLTSVQLSNIASLGTSAFSGCYGLKEITISGTITTLNGAVFENCFILETVSLPNSITSIGNYCFRACYELHNITLPSNLTSIGGYAFNSCYDLESITIPDTVTTIGEYAFSDCLILNEINTGENSTLSNIGNYAFQNTDIREFTLPSTMSNLGTYAFYSCGALSKVIVKSNFPFTIGSYAFGHTALATTTSAIKNYMTAIYVPAEVINAFKTATNWSQNQENIIGY